MLIGPESKEALTAAINLSTVLRNVGDARGAEALLVEALETARRVHGDTSSLTATVLNNLGVLLKREPSRRGQALECYEEALRIRSYSLGSSHPDTIISMNNLAELHISLGDTTAADEIQRSILEALGAKDENKDKG